jgi:undecaprenyl diphosphate synthase
MQSEQNVPNHIAIIMDGNGRWAKEKGLKRSQGHKEGAKALKRTIEAMGKLGVKYLTVFAFSSENWKRPQEEIDTIMNLLKQYVDTELPNLIKNNVIMKVIGDKEGLAKDIREKIEKAEKESLANADHNKETYHLIIALNYGGKDEIINAAKKIAEKTREGKIDPAKIDEQIVEQNLWMAGIPDVDLVIRTSGEKRISNFILWKIAYAELVFLNGYWPDFGEKQLMEALDEFKKRKRRFGKAE